MKDLHWGGNTSIFVGRSFSCGLNLAKAKRLEPLKYRFCSSPPGPSAAAQFSATPQRPKVQSE